MFQKGYLPIIYFCYLLIPYWRHTKESENFNLGVYTVHLKQFVPGSIIRLDIKLQTPCALNFSN